MEGMGVRVSVRVGVGVRVRACKRNRTLCVRGPCSVSLLLYMSLWFMNRAWREKKEAAMDRGETIDEVITSLYGWKKCADTAEERMRVVDGACRGKMTSQRSLFSFLFVARCLTLEVSNKVRKSEHFWLSPLCCYAIYLGNVSRFLLRQVREERKKREREKETKNALFVSHPLTFYRAA